MCARGFEEEKCFPTDSPNCCKEGLRLVCCVISSNKWLTNSLDVKTAFLLGKPIERTVFVRPSKEAKTDKVAGMTRSEISFFVCETSTRVKDATVSDLIAANNIVKFIQNTTTYICIPLFDIEPLNIKLYSDASFNNLPNGGSQGGFIILLSDKYNNVAPIAWSSVKLKRVARSTIAAEALALSDGCDTSYFVATLTKEIIFMKQHNDINIEAFTDNRSLYETVHTAKPILDKRLRVEIAALREMCEKNELQISWIEKQHQLSDVLTKTRASPKTPIETIQKGKLQ